MQELPQFWAVDCQEMKWLRHCERQSTALDVTSVIKPLCSRPSKDIVTEHAVRNLLRSERVAGTERQF